MSAYYSKLQAPECMKYFLCLDEVRIGDALDQGAPTAARIQEKSFTPTIERALAGPGSLWAGTGRCFGQLN